MCIRDSSKYTWGLSATISGTALTLNPSNIAAIGNYGSADIGVAAAYMDGNNRGRIAVFSKTDSGNNNTMSSSATTVVTSNLVHQDHYIGFADQAYSDGQTATILSYGNNVNTLSGLTAGTKYFIQSDGSLATTADSTLTGYFVANTPIAGTALSATKLLIRDPTVRA